MKVNMKVNMKQATLVEPQKIEFSNIPIPVPQNDEVLIKVDYIGICGSDLHAFYGKHPFISCPIVMGHEISGVVVEIGKDVKKVKVDDHVTIMPQIFCHNCEPCKNGRYNICESLEVIGCQVTGAASEYFSCPESLVKVIPDSIKMNIAATIEPVAVGVHAVGRGIDISGKNVVVMGAGTIGNLTAQAAVAKGAKGVLITDLMDYRLEVAKKCGIPFVANTGKISLKDAIYEAFGEDGCDIFFECIGIGSTINQAIELSKKGNDIVVVGVFGNRPEINMSFVQDKEIRLIGSLMYVEKDYDDAIQFMKEGKINTKDLITKEFNFDEYQDAFKYIEANSDKSIKILIKVVSDDVI